MIHGRTYGWDDDGSRWSVQSYRYMFDRAPDDDFVVTDCETTGLNVRTADIVTIAAIRIRGNRILAHTRQKS
ncbi:exonuclease domain-containing protein [Bradyrhizobium sp. UFLA05-109]